MITATHTGGRERTGGTGILYLMEWLLSGDSLAREILARQVLVCMPVPNPDGYMTEGVDNHHNGFGLNPCNHWTLDGPIDPDRNPEGVAVQTLIDRYQPEVHTDFHGIDLTWPNHIGAESTGRAYGSSFSRPYHQEIVRLMDAAALEEGFPSDMADQDAERLFWWPEFDAIEEKVWLGRPTILATGYSYARYHTLVMHHEVFWERSGLLKHRRLMQIGNDVWPGEYYPGYPTRVIMWNNFELLTAYGATASARRKSRVELWNKQRQIRLGMVNPEIEGTKVCMLITEADRAEEWLADTSLETVIEKIRQQPGIDADAILPLFDQYPRYPGQWGPQARLAMIGGESPAAVSSPIEHGLACRLRIPYPRARLEGVRVNGREIQPSETDGYVTWAARGYTYVQINFPPETLRRRHVFIVTCKYDPMVKHAHPVSW